MVLGRYNAAKRLTRSDNLHFYDDEKVRVAFLALAYGCKFLTVIKFNEITIQSIYFVLMANISTLLMEINDKYKQQL